MPATMMDGKIVHEEAVDWELPKDLSSGDALDLSLGGYGLAASPIGGADWQLKFGISLFFP